MWEIELVQSRSNNYFNICGKPLSQRIEALDLNGRKPTIKSTGKPNGKSSIWVCIEFNRYSISKCKHVPSYQNQDGSITFDLTGNDVCVVLQ